MDFGKQDVEVVHKQDELQLGILCDKEEVHVLVLEVDTFGLAVDTGKDWGCIDEDKAEEGSFHMEVAGCVRHNARNDKAEHNLTVWLWMMNPI